MKGSNTSCFKAHIYVCATRVKHTQKTSVTGLGGGCGGGGRLGAADVARSLTQVLFCCC